MHECVPLSVQEPYVFGGGQRSVGVNSSGIVKIHISRLETWTHLTISIIRYVRYVSAE